MNPKPKEVLKQHLKSQVVASEILNSVILHRAASIHCPQQLAIKHSIDKSQNLTDSIINLVNEKNLLTPSQWKEQRQTKIKPTSFKIKLYHSRHCNDSKSQTLNLDDIKQQASSILKSKDLHSDMKSSKKDRNSKQNSIFKQRTSCYNKSKKIIPLQTCNKENEIDVEFQRFLRESKENKHGFILQQKVNHSPKTRNREEKWVKNNNQNKINPHTTDYNGQPIIMNKLDQIKYLAHYVEVNVETSKTPEKRKKQKKFFTNDLTLKKNFKRIKEEQPVFGKNILTNFKLSKGVKSPLQKTEESKNGQQNVNKERQAEKDYAKMKLSEFIKQKEDRSKDKTIEKQIKNSEKNYFPKAGMTKKLISQNNISYHQEDEGIQLQAKKTSTFKETSIKINNVTALNYLINDSMKPKAKKIVKIDEQFIK